MTSEFAWQLIGVGIMFISIILDGCDGEVARYKKMGSPAGVLYVEPVSHDIQYAFIFPLLGLGLYLADKSWIFIVTGFIAGMAKLLFRLLEMRFWTLKHGHDRNSTDGDIDAFRQNFYKKNSLVRLVYWFNKNIFSSTGVFTLILIAVLIQKIDWYVYLYAIGYVLLWLALFAKQTFAIMRKRV
jgi:phosphatidylglycerophosphate synthase